MLLSGYTERELALFAVSVILVAGAAAALHPEAAARFQTRPPSAETSQVQ